MDSGSGAMGHIVYTLTAVNSSATSTCTLRGYPGVSLVVGTAGQQLGMAAQRASGDAPLITLAPGKHAIALLQLTQPANVPDCGVTTAAGWRIYLPDDTSDQFIPAAVSGCSNAAARNLEIQPFQVPTS